MQDRLGRGDQTTNDRSCWNNQQGILFTLSSCLNLDQSIHRNYPPPRELLRVIRPGEQCVTSHPCHPVSRVVHPCCMGVVPNGLPIPGNTVIGISSLRVSEAQAEHLAAAARLKEIECVCPLVGLRPWSVPTSTHDRAIPDWHGAQTRLCPWECVPGWPDTPPS